MSTASVPDPGERPGRVCPIDYRTDPADLARPADISCSTLYVIGGLYGNSFALDAIEALAAAEPAPVTLVFNGDAHWFDAERQCFGSMDARLARYLAIKGNVEFELARSSDAGAGCGCAYPVDVDDGVVERSNWILSRLRDMLGPCSPILARLRTLPLTLVAKVGSVRIGIVHGDPTSVAGWGFARERLDDPASRPWLDSIRANSRIDIFASTHTCAAVMRRLDLPSGPLVVANNGAAGMGNFNGDWRGLITRISSRSSPHAAVYGLRMADVHVDALPVAFDVDAFTREFDAIWPEGSAAAVSYRQRIVGKFAGAELESARPASTRRHHQRKAALPISPPAMATKPMPIGYQVATNSGESSGQ